MQASPIDASMSECCSNVLTVHVYFLWKRRSDSSGIGVVGVTM